MARGSLVAAASCRAANARLLAQQVLEPARHCRLWTGHDPGVSSVRGPAPIGRTSTVSPMAATIRTAIAQQVPVLLSRTVVLDSPLGSDRGLEREVVAVGVGEPDHCVVTAVEPERLLRYTWRNGPLDTVVTWRLAPEGNGTRLLLEHHGFDLNDPAQRRAFDGMSGGWRTLIVADLAHHLAPCG